MRIDPYTGSAGLRVTFTDGKALEVDQVMFATGRVPNVAGLDIHNSGVEVTPDGRVRVNEFSRSNVEHIYAVGDVTSRVNLTPVAIYEGHAFADSVFGGKVRPVTHEFVPSAVFSQPPVGTVGFSEADARHHFGEIDVYCSRFLAYRRREHNSPPGRRNDALEANPLFLEAAMPRLEHLDPLRESLPGLTARSTYCRLFEAGTGIIRVP